MRTCVCAPARDLVVREVGQPLAEPPGPRVPPQRDDGLPEAQELADRARLGLAGRAARLAGERQPPDLGRVLLAHRGDEPEAVQVLQGEDLAVAHQARLLEPVEDLGAVRGPEAEVAGLGLEPADGLEDGAEDAGGALVQRLRAGQVPQLDALVLEDHVDVLLHRPALHVGDLRGVDPEPREDLRRPAVCLGRHDVREPVQVRERKGVATAACWVVLAQKYRHDCSEGTLPLLAPL